MPTVQVTVTELRDKDPTRFDKEYYRWCAHTPYDGWAECVEGDFRERHAPQGVEATSIWYSLHGQGSYASFSGSVDAAKLMKHLKLDEEYLPLYLAMENDGSRFSVSGWGRGRLNVDFDGVPWDTDASGVFSALDRDEWCELINAQFDASGLESLVEEFCNDICDTLLNELEAEYDSLTSEEEFIASCEINEVTFVIEGDEE